MVAVGTLVHLGFKTTTRCSQVDDGEYFVH